ncbi:MAG TPA: S24 family peptidase [Rhizomicrobium sp.]
MAGRKSKEKATKSNIVEDGPAAFRGDFGERLRWLLDQFETRVEAGEIAGVTPEHMPAYIAGRAEPRFAAIARLAAAKNVSLDWLATGDGARLTVETEPDGYVAIALQPEGGARFGADDEGAILFSRSWLRAATAAAPEALRLVVNRGNANEPVIRDGDLLLVDTTVKQIADDGLYVFPRDGKYLARFVETYVDGRVALKARNPEYGMQPLSGDDAAKLPLLGRVLWRGGAL